MSTTFPEKELSSLLVIPSIFSDKNYCAHFNSPYELFRDHYGQIAYKTQQHTLPARPQIN